MAHVIEFTTSRFDISKETPNPINPIAGQSVLSWLRQELIRAGYTVSEPATEDWGWYVGVEKDGASYLVGASADAENAAADVDWVIQVHKSRSLKDRMFGSNTMAVDDPLVALIEKVIRSDNTIQNVSSTREP